MTTQTRVLLRNRVELWHPSQLVEAELAQMSPQKSASRKRDAVDRPRVPISSKPVSEVPTIRELTLLWFALPRPAHREQENGTLVLCVR
jgi:hypothetical protein